MRFPDHRELPGEKQDVVRSATRIEWLSVAYFISLIVILYFTLGQSQAMKAAFIEDVLSLIPPIAFLIAARQRHQKPDERFPFGQHRSVDIGYLVSAVALLTLGGYLLWDSVHTLALAEHPSIGLVEIFDTQIWLGWLMLAVIAYTGIPPVILGRMKLPLAEDLHDKVLHADAEMNRADWMTAGAAAFGILGIGLGWWWADAAAAIVIAVDIVHDGFRYSKAAVFALADHRPTTFDEKRVHPLYATVRRCVGGWDWIEAAAIRMRESGHLLSVEVLAVPTHEPGVLDRVERAVDELRDLDWKVCDVVVSVVRELENVPPELVVRPRS